MNRVHLTQSNLDRFKQLFPEDGRLQALTLDELVRYAAGKDLTGVGAEIVAPSDRALRSVGPVTDCQIAVAGVVVDCIFVIAGAIGLHGKLPPSAVEEVARIIEPELSEIEKIVRILADSASSTKMRAKAIFDIGKLIYTAGMLEAVYKAIVNSLTWWDMALYGTLGLAELVAAFATDGVALIALVVAEIAQVGFVISDSVKVVNACV